VSRESHLAAVYHALQLVGETRSELTATGNRYGRLDAALADAVGIEPGPDPGQRAYELAGLLGDAISDAVRLCTNIEEKLLEYRRGI
jgi:hypothetical protein